MKLRLTYEQRSALREYLIEQRNVLDQYKPPADVVAKLATEYLGFEVKPSHVYYQLSLINSNEETPEEEVMEDPYKESNATATHGRVAPWLLDEAQRSIETLERIRRLEVLVNLIADHVGVERKAQQFRQPTQQMEMFSADDHRKAVGAQHMSTMRRLLGGGR